LYDKVIALLSSPSPLFASIWNHVFTYNLII
jgi:hypothetical protein